MIEFRERLVELTPALMGFAFNLTKNANDAQDLVQDTLARALANEHRYSEDNLRAWLMTMMRNVFYTNTHRVRRVQYVGTNDGLPHQPVCDGGQLERLEVQDLKERLSELVPEQRDALLAWAGGNDYQEIADLFGVPIGTIRSRMNRGRKKLGLRKPEEAE